MSLPWRPIQARTHRLLQWRSSVLLILTFLDLKVALFKGRCSLVSSGCHRRKAIARQGQRRSWGYGWSLWGKPWSGRAPEQWRNMCLRSWPHTWHRMLGQWLLLPSQSWLPNIGNRKLWRILTDRRAKDQFKLQCSWNLIVPRKMKTQEHLRAKMNV